MNRLASAALIALVTAGMATAQVITSISPSWVVAGSPDTVITITGSGFTPNDQVEVLGLELTPNYINSTRLTVTVPASALTFPTSGYLVVLGVELAFTSFDVTIPFTTPSTLPPGTVAVPYAQPITIFGSSGPTPEWEYEWTITAGSLPPGLEFDYETQVIRGIPTEAGVFHFTVMVMELYSEVPTWGEQDFVLIINPPRAPLSIWAPETLPDGAVGKRYAENVYASGGTQPYSWEASSLPPGLIMASSGVLVGTPTQAGTFEVTVIVKDSAGASAVRTYVLNIARPALEIVTTSPLPAGSVGVAYSLALAARGDHPPFAWAVSRLPPGLKLNGATGEIEGIPTLEGNFSFTVRVTDSAQNSASRDFAMTIGPRALSIATASPLAPGTEGMNYSAVFEAVVGSPPYTWSLSGAGVPGLTLDAASGVLSGIPAAAGNFSFTVEVRDSAGASASKAFALTVNSGLAIATASLASGMVGTPYSQALEGTGGTPPYSWSVAGALPAGISMDGESGTLSGTPAAAGVFAIVVRIMDSNGATATRTLPLTVRPPGLPQISLSAPGSSSPAQQIKVAGTVDSGYPLPLDCQLTLTFTPDAVQQVDDPAIQFATGGRVFNFTVPGGAVQFPDAAIQTGTVAGTIVIELARVEAGGVDLTPSPRLQKTIVVNRATPVITSVKIIRSAAGFEVQVNGYSTAREVTQAKFTFAAAGSRVQTPEVTVSVQPMFTAWYNDPASQQFGSMFTYVQPFNVQGDLSGLASVSVTLSNSMGASQPVTVNF
ncbi:MAG: putative Ig domain-containing protein [Rhodospirillales bacterium]